MRNGSLVGLSFLVVLPATFWQVYYPSSPPIRNHATRNDHLDHTNTFYERLGPAPNGPSTGLRDVPGTIEPIPQNVFHATPYNGWPLLEIKVREGQRLHFRRENGGWSGDSKALFIQFETPAEIDGKKEEVEIASMEKRSAELARDVTRAGVGGEIEAANLRERDARQKHDRLARLSERTAATQADLERARNVLDLAVAQGRRTKSEADGKLGLADLQVELAERRLRRAQSEWMLADFKRSLSWADVPAARGRFEEVVVTRVLGVRGDVPSPGGVRDAWIEVIDDRLLYARAFLTVGQVDRLKIGGRAAILQEGKAFEGVISSSSIIAAAETGLIPVIVTVENRDRTLKINTRVRVDFEPNDR